MHVRHAIAVAFSLSIAATSGCKKGDAGASPAGSAAPASTSGAAATAAANGGATVPVGNFALPFAGTYTRTAKVAFRNGQRIKTSSGKGVATLKIEPGKVTYHVEYTSGSGASAHVTELYSFAQSDVHTVSDGLDANLTYVSMDSDDKGYNPDSKDVKVEARKQGAGWEIGFLYRDTGGIQAGSEFH